MDDSDFRTGAGYGIFRFRDLPPTFERSLLPTSPDRTTLGTQSLWSGLLNYVRNFLF
jgi:hypothetical protein